MGKSTRLRLSEHGNDETRQALLTAARNLFVERGYHNVGVRDFAAAAGVTRGALYYYFPDKESVFLAVIDSMQKKRIAEATIRHQAIDRPDPWTEFRQDIQIALDEALDKEIQRILFIDAPSVLGWPRCRELDTQYGLGITINIIKQCLKRELIAEVDPHSLAHLITASVTEASLMIAHSDNPEQSRISVGRTLDTMLKGLQRPPAQ